MVHRDSALSQHNEKIKFSINVSSSEELAAKQGTTGSTPDHSQEPMSLLLAHLVPQPCPEETSTC